MWGMINFSGADLIKFCLKSYKKDLYTGQSREFKDLCVILCVHDFLT